MTEWTRTEDALPEEGTRVLVYNDLHDTLYGATLVQRDKLYWEVPEHRDEWAELLPLAHTYWMPILELPKGTAMTTSPTP